MGENERAGGEDRRQFHDMGPLGNFLDADDFYDMDQGLEKIMNQMRATGSIVIPLGESVQRVRDPLSDETARNFGDRALRALARTDLYIDSAEQPPNNL